MADYILLAVFAFCVALHSGAETGFYCMNPVRVRYRAREGWLSARFLLWMHRRPRLAINTCLVGTNVGVYLATVTCALMLRQAGLAHRAGLYSTLIMSPILLIFAELLPKCLYQWRADTLMYKSAYPLSVSTALFAPAIAVLHWIGELFLPAPGRGSIELRHRVTREGFRFLLRVGSVQGALSDYARAMSENILRLKSRPISQVITPLKQVVMAPEDIDFKGLMELMRGERFSRIPVFRGQRGAVVGVVNIIDVVSSEQQGDLPVAVARKPYFLDAGTSVAEALFVLQQARQQMGIVRGRQGAAVGIVTIKDLVEEIVGKLQAW